MSLDVDTSTRGKGSSISTSNTTTIGLSKDLTIPLIIKLCYLQPSIKSINKVKSNLARSSIKYSQPEIFSKLSNISLNSDLFIKIEIFDGNNNLISNSIQTSYKNFQSNSNSSNSNKNKRVWDQFYKLSVNYNQLPIDAYLKFTIYEIVHSKSSIFGIGYLSIFNKLNSTLRKGSHKIKVFTNLSKLQRGKPVKVEYGNMPGLTKIEENLINYENGEFSRSNWLDKLSLSKIENQRYSKYNELSENGENQEEEEEDDDDIVYYLYIELPNFDLSIVYSDKIYTLPNHLKNIDSFNNNLTATDSQNNFNNTNNSNIIINSIDIPMLRSSSTSMKVYDPDFDNLNLQNLQNLQSLNNDLPAKNYNVSSGGVNGVGGSGSGGITGNINYLDPIEMKYHKLERNINNNSILDKELKPTPQIRDELLKILNKPSNIELNEFEKNLIWKFRYYFSKNNSISNNKIFDDENSTSTSHKPITPKTNRNVKLFLTKFLKSINWDNDYELDHAFNEIIPNYWTVDKIQIGDALELLSNYFNPYTLTSGFLLRSGNENNHNNNAQENNLNKDQINNDELKFKKIFNHVIFLRKFAVDRLKLANGDELLLYLLQLVQALKFEAIIFENELISNSSLQPSVDDNDSLIMKSPLAKFLIEKSIENNKLGNFFYWYVKVENEDQLNNINNNGSDNYPIKIYSLVLNKYIENLKKYSSTNKLPNYSFLKRQIWFIKKLTNLVELLRFTFKKNEATAKKIQFLRDYLSDTSNEFLKFPEPLPLPLDPSIIICGVYPNESSVFKSSLAPLKITFKTITNYKENVQSHSSQIFGGKKNYKYDKFSLMFKIGDDLRQDQLVIQIINLMDQLLKTENLDLRLTPYKILATSPIAGLIQFVPNETLDSVLSQTYPISLTQDSDNQTGNHDNETTVSNNGILSYLKLHSKELHTIEPQATSVLLSSDQQSQQQQNQKQHAITSDLGVSSIVMDNYVKSCAGYCVITYLLGVGDRHLDNLLLSPNGKFWHADFGYILGRDPKPFPPLMKLPIQVIDGMGGLNHENFSIFKSYCFITYTTLRKNSNLILNLFQLMLDANIPDIKIDPKRAVEKVQEKFCLEMSEEEAILHFQNLINDSVNAFLPVVIDRLHSLAQYWRA